MHWKDRVVDCRLLELYAGSGAVSFEALSRGASHVLAMDRSRQSGRCVRTNWRRLGTHDGSDALRFRQVDLPGGLTSALTGASAFDLVFADPPYDHDKDALREMLDAACQAVADEGELVLEHAVHVVVPERAGRLQLLASRRFGDSVLAFYA